MKCLLDEKSVDKLIINYIIGKLENDKLRMNGYECMEKGQGVVDYWCNWGSVGVV